MQGSGLLVDQAIRHVGFSTVGLVLRVAIFCFATSLLVAVQGLAFRRLRR